ncbi:MAG TPA: HAD family hydrolase, partial [Novosphingobium sp.]|nr:HAD family hydrolase [Novosphingobium sp.]
LPVYTNQGPKGPALKAIVDEYRPSRVVFIDDLAQHHGSVSEVAPDVVRLHLCGEPLIAPHITCGLAAGHAHARIDDWATALPWIVERL